MFQKLKSEDNLNFYITNKKYFENKGVFKRNTIEKCFEFAWNMSFGSGGEHRKYRSGGSHIRENIEIFSNAFQGKLGEYSVFNIFFINSLNLEEPDLETYELGKWDKFDFKFNNLNISVKSTAFFGNLLLLETKDWNKEGMYIPSNIIYDYHILTRISPNGKEILNKIGENISKLKLKEIIISKAWTWEVTGYITKKDLIEIISNKFILPKGSRLNGKVLMDAENYYIQAGDLKDINNLITEIQNYEKK